MSAIGNMAARVTELEGQLHWKQVDLEASRSTERIALQAMAEAQAELARVQAQADEAVTLAEAQAARTDEVIAVIGVAHRAEIERLTIRARKAERELAEACAELATANRRIAELESYRRATLAGGA